MTTTHMVDSNIKPKHDSAFQTIAQYVMQTKPASALAMETARYCLIDSISCMMLALQYPACTKLLGPIIPGTTVPTGARVPGTDYELDPILAAFNIGALVRWLDFNDTWLAAEWGHPSDNIGAILAVTDYLSRKNKQEKKSPFTVKDVLSALIKAHEIQGVLALENGFNRLGFDHVILVRIASTAVAAFLLGCDENQIMDALSQAFVDGAALRTYRHAPNTGSRKSWAAGDATSRAVRLAWLTLQGEKGYPSALTTKKWGFNDCILKGGSLQFARPFENYVMENVLFKIAFPAEFHAQTAVECAIQLHPSVKDRLNDIDQIILETQESAVRIISKEGPLHNPADRDHCLQYMVAVPLIHGNLTAEHYEDRFATDPMIDRLREKMVVRENPAFTKDYLDPDKRSITNSIQIKFKDGSVTEKVVIEYPIGHKRRRKEGIPLLLQKFEKSLTHVFDEARQKKIVDLCYNHDALLNTPVDELMDLLCFEINQNTNEDFDSTLTDGLDDETW